MGYWECFEVRRGVGMVGEGRGPPPLRTACSWPGCVQASQTNLSDLTYVFELKTKLCCGWWLQDRKLNVHVPVHVTLDKGWVIRTNYSRSGMDIEKACGPLLYWSVG